MFPKILRQQQMDTISLRSLSNSLGSLWSWWRHFLMPYYRAWWDMDQYEPQLMCQCNEWRHYGSPRKIKVLHNPTNVKDMAILLYGCDGDILNTYHTAKTYYSINAQYFRHFWSLTRDQRCERSSNTYCRTLPSFCIVMLGYTLHTMYLICTVPGVRECFYFHQIH